VIPRCPFNASAAARIRLGVTEPMRSAASAATSIDDTWLIPAWTTARAGSTARADGAIQLPGAHS
jgi:hypothetical protein